jgi:hypothetical protein
MKKPEQGARHFSLEIIRSNKKSGCVFTKVERLTGNIDNIMRPFSSAFWVDARKYDLYAVNFENSVYTTVYKFFPFGRSGRWELCDFTTPDFKPSKDFKYMQKYRGPRTGTHRYKRAVRREALQIG